MSDLQARLDSLFRSGLLRKGVKGGGGLSPGKSPSRGRGTVFEGEEVGDEGEKCLLFSHRFPPDYVFGLGTPVCDLLSVPESLQGIHAEEAIPAVRREEILFLDIETTGLAMGTGTYAFLVGVGYFMDEGFRVDQYFMRDYNEEEALLSSVGEAAAPFCLLVTFNGRAFDLQLLRNRYLMNGRLPPLELMTDLDLLYLSRRFFRRRLDDCRLKTIERDVLGFRRVDDVDGSLIPGLYFHFLRTGEFPLLDRVLRHNRWDILSLAYLAHLFSSALRDPLRSESLHGGAFLSIGVHFERSGHGDSEMVDRCYREAMRGGLGSDEAYEAARRLSLRLKRRGDYEGAEEIWRLMAQDDHRFDVFPLVELAKYHEHRQRDFSKALVLTERALARLEGGRDFLPQSWLSVTKGELLHRLSRLRRRMEGEETRGTTLG